MSWKHHLYRTKVEALLTKLGSTLSSDRFASVAAGTTDVAAAVEAAQPDEDPIPSLLTVFDALVDKVVDLMDALGTGADTDLLARLDQAIDDATT